MVFIDIPSNIFVAHILFCKLLLTVILISNFFLKAAFSCRNCKKNKIKSKCVDFSWVQLFSCRLYVWHMFESNMYGRMDLWCTRLLQCSLDTEHSRLLKDEILAMPDLTSDSMWHWTLHTHTACCFYSGLLINLSFSALSCEEKFKKSSADGNGLNQFIWHCAMHILLRDYRSISEIRSNHHRMETGE